MIIYSSSEEPSKSRHPGGHPGYWVTGYTGRGHRQFGKISPLSERPDRDQIYPMAFLVEQEAYSIGKAHFHIADQFQLFVSGSGRLGASGVERVTFQFAAAYSPYGPIEAGTGGLNYLTLRNRFDPGSRSMPEARNELPAKRNFRQVVHGPLHPMSVTDLGAVPSASQDELIAPAPGDGLGAWRYRLPAGQAAIGPDPSTGDGQHWIVLSGSLEGRDGKMLPVNSCVFLSREESGFQFKSGPQGIEILVLQYPFHQKN